LIPIRSQPRLHHDHLNPSVLKIRREHRTTFGTVIGDPAFFSQMALVSRGKKPASVIFHSDRGTQYASAQITAFAEANGITRSMGYTGICWDNALAESFFATLKTEFYYRRFWPTKARAVREVGAWIEDRYNRRRRHYALGQVSPVEFELQYSSHPAEVLFAA